MPLCEPALAQTVATMHSRECQATERDVLERFARSDIADTTQYPDDQGNY